jgi:hypothetical protein
VGLIQIKEGRRSINMEDKLIYRRVKKDSRKGMICNYVEVSISWDGGGCTREELRNLEFIKDKKETKEVIK